MLISYPESVLLSDIDGRTPLDIVTRLKLGNNIERILLKACPQANPVRLGELTYYLEKEKDEYRNSKKIVRKKLSHVKKIDENFNNNGIYNNY